MGISYYYAACDTERDGRSLQGARIHTYFVYMKDRFATVALLPVMAALKHLSVRTVTLLTRKNGEVEREGAPLDAVILVGNGVSQLLSLGRPR